MFIRYDYHAGRLFVQFPSAIHESGVEAIAHEITKCRTLVEAQERRVASRWALYSCRGCWYEGGPQEGKFIADSTLNVNDEPVLFVEVAFTQTWPNLRSKVGRILNEASILGVLVMHIIEMPKWSSPARRSVADDFIDRQHWVSQVRTSQAARPFGRIMVNNIFWVENIAVNIYFFKKSWKDGDDDPPKVSFQAPDRINLCLTLLQFPLQPDGNINLSDLDAQLSRVWDAIMIYM
jgi:hypothetical protein